MRNAILINIIVVLFIVLSCSTSKDNQKVYLSPAIVSRFDIENNQQDYYKCEYAFENDRIAENGIVYEDLKNISNQNMPMYGKIYASSLFTVGKQFHLRQVEV